MPLSKLNPNSFANTVEGNPSLIINGDMAVWQRGTAATTVSGQGVYQTVDRFKLYAFTDGAYTSERSTTVPSGQGFGYSLKLAVTTADTSLGTLQYACFAQDIEAQNLQHLSYGTSDAKSLTLSFWVRSSKTGTYSIALDKNDATRYHFVKEYSIDTADTWEKKTITIQPDSQIKASAGAIANDNGHGLRLFFNLAWGSNYNNGTDNTWSSDTLDFTTSNQVNWMDSTSNDFYITGVKLEVGDTTTPFLHESYGENLAKCQRYYYKHCEGTNQHVSLGDAWATLQMDAVVHFPVTMRATPTLDANSGTGYWGAFITGVLRTTNTGWILFRAMPTGTTLYNQGFSSLTLGHAGRVIVNNANAYMAFDAEL